MSLEEWEALPVEMQDTALALDLYQVAAVVEDPTPPQVAPPAAEEE